MDGGASYVNDVDNLKATELRLGLPGTGDPATEKPAPATARINNKRSLSEDCKPSKNTKAQVVGWPPVRSFRRNSFLPRETDQAAAADAGAGLYVKVSMDGAPYLRKIDLKMYKGYKDLREGLEDMFKCFSLGDLSGKEEPNRSEYAIAYEDKDGDLMLAGDVPWEMFISSCRKLRVMKGSEARGLGSPL